MKAIRMGAAIIGAAVFISTLNRPASAVEPRATVSVEEVEQGLAISPVPVRLTGKDRTLVGLGSYIVNSQANCTDCHTCPPYAVGTNPFTGDEPRVNTNNFLAGGRKLGGAISRNITPDDKGRPAGLTYEQFARALRTGRRAGSDEILQVMPWPLYHNMKERDLRAIYEYLSSIPHAEPGHCD